MFIRNLLILVFVLITTHIFSQNSSNDYLGFKPPKNRPVKFAPEFISIDNRIEGRGTFSSDEKKFYFTVSDELFVDQKIFYTEYVNGKWTHPDTADFSKYFACWEPYYSHDDKRIYFTGNKNSTRSPKSNGQDFFFVENKNGDWTTPQRMDSSINSDYTDLFISVLKNGDAYFTSERLGGKRISNVYVGKYLGNDKYAVLDIGQTINKGLYNWDPCIAPDESFMIFSCVKKHRQKRMADLYITYNKGDKWSKPKRMGNKINTDANEYGAFLSNDSKYLFFVRLGEGNNGDIYWIDLSSIIKR